MVEILPIWRKTLSNQSINQSNNTRCNVRRVCFHRVVEEKETLLLVIKKSHVSVCRLPFFLNPYLTTTISPYRDFDEY